MQKRAENNKFCSFFKKKCIFLKKNLVDSKKSSTFAPAFEK